MHRASGIRAQERRLSGFPGVAVDGNDLFAVYATTVEAVDRALSGGGPTLIECRTYRMGFHNTSDNPKEYRDSAEVKEAEQRDPVERVRRFATRVGIWSAEREAAVLDEIHSEIETAQQLNLVENLPRPGESSWVRSRLRNTATSPRATARRGLNRCQVGMFLVIAHAARSLDRVVHGCALGTDSIIPDFATSNKDYKNGRGGRI